MFQLSGFYYNPKTILKLLSFEGPKPGLARAAVQVEAMVSVRPRHPSGAAQTFLRGFRDFGRGGGGGVGFRVWGPFSGGLRV